MMIKVAVSDCFKLKMIPSFRSVFFPEKQEIHYIGGTDRTAFKQGTGNRADAIRTRNPRRGRKNAERSGRSSWDLPVLHIKT